MKDLIKKTVLFAAVAVAFVNAQAHEEHVPFHGYHAELESINLHPNHDQGYTADGGSIDIDMTKGEISLTIYQSIDCPPNMACIALMPAPLRISLPLVSTETTSCGDVIYTAMKDKTPADGALETLRVVDHTKNECLHTRMLPATAITYSTYIMRWMPEDPNQEATSTFTAGPLVEEMCDR